MSGVWYGPVHSQVRPLIADYAPVLQCSLDSVLKPLHFDLNHVFQLKSCDIVISEEKW